MDAIDEYSRRVTAELCGMGTAARYLSGGLGSALDVPVDPPWVLLQYNPFSYGRAGFAPRLMRQVRELQSRQIPMAVMVHEAWIDIADTRSALIGSWQRAQLRDVLRFAERVMTSTEALAAEIGNGAVHVPIASNIPPAAVSRETARAQLALEDRLVVALFGQDHPTRALGYAEAAIASLAKAHGPESLVVLNLGARAPLVAVPSGVELRTPGQLAADAVSLHLRAADLAALPFTDGLQTRRTTLMAALAHGLPVVGLRGPKTDALLVNATGVVTLSPVGEQGAFAKSAVELTRDLSALRARGIAAEALYMSTFDWPVLASKVSDVLNEMRESRSRHIVYVANDIGGSGGMERHCERHISGLIESGRQVTVVSRTCKMEPRPGLTFERVRSPGRPFVIGYPAFFIEASRLVARHPDALVHTTGAIVPNRAAVSTVHYCHRAASGKVDAPRASREDLLHRVNAELATVISLVGERWCYRRARTHTLCAVSSGVANELRDSFPSMTGAIESIPNGVDSEHFRPDPEARRATRTRLGLDDDVPLALFVGGDWSRKGLSWAIKSLALAQPWHLAVAGPGDADGARAEARAVDAVDRLHLLGSVRDMPPIYAAADAFILPTTYEAFPLVILEAAASGLPLLVTRVNGAEELLEDGVQGWFVERDDVDIARRLGELAEAPELAASMARAAREAAQIYSWEAMTERYLSVYDRR